MIGLMTARNAPRPTPQPLDLLVVAVHPDDAEISVGGTVLKLVRAGKRVGILDLTTGEPTPHGSDEIRAAETAAANDVLGNPWRKNINLPNRKLEATLDARAAIAGIFRQTRPRVILAPYWDDAHPDHVAASQLVDDARFWAKLSRTDLPGEPFHPPRVYYYFSIHLRMLEQASFVVDVSDTFEEKLKAVACYESQFRGKLETFPTPLDDLRGRARYWGWSIGKAYGEPFASREPIGVGDFDALI